MFAGCDIACFIQNDRIREGPARIDSYFVMHLSLLRRRNIVRVGLRVKICEVCP